MRWKVKTIRNTVINNKKSYSSLVCNSSFCSLKSILDHDGPEKTQWYYTRRRCGIERLLEGCCTAYGQMAANLWTGCPHHTARVGQAYSTASVLSCLSYLCREKTTFKNVAQNVQNKDKKTCSGTFFMEHCVSMSVVTSLFGT